MNVNEPQISGILTYMYISGQYVHMYVQCVCVCVCVCVCARACNILLFFGYYTNFAEAQGVSQKSDAPASSSSESSESGKYR